MFEKNKEKMKEKMEPDKVLRFAIVAVILLFLIGALIIGTRMMNPRVDATEGVKKLTELEDANVQKIDAKINRLVDLRAAINAAIESMENPEERLLLKYRYLKNESWEDISYDLNVSYRTVHRIHASALNNFVVPE